MYSIRVFLKELLFCHIVAALQLSSNSVPTPTKGGGLLSAKQTTGGEREGSALLEMRENPI